MLFVKVLGIIDIIVGIIILFNFPVAGAFILFLILLGKGLLSMMADNIGKIYGAFDIIAGIIILFSINIGFGLAIFFFLFFLYKVLVSLVPR